MADGPIERLRARLGDFTPSEEAAARYFIEHPTSVVNKTIAAVGPEAGRTTNPKKPHCQLEARLPSCAVASGSAIAATRSFASA